MSLAMANAYYYDILLLYFVSIFVVFYVIYFY